MQTNLLVDKGAYYPVRHFSVGGCVHVQKLFEHELAIAILVEPKKVFEPYLNPKNIPLDPKKTKKLKVMGV